MSIQWHDSPDQIPTVRALLRRVLRIDRGSRCGGPWVDASDHPTTVGVHPDAANTHQK